MPLRGLAPASGTLRGVDYAFTTKLVPSGDTTGLTDTAAINAAAAAVFNSGVNGVVELGPGLWYAHLTGTASVNSGTANCPYCINVPGGVWIRGSGVGITTIINTNQHKTGAVGDVCDNIFLLNNAPLARVSDLAVQGNAVNADPLLTSLAGQGGYAFYVSGGTSSWAIERVSVTNVRQGAFCVGGDSVTVASQQAAVGRIKEVSLALKKAAALMVTAAVNCNFEDFSGTGGEFSFIGGPTNHCSWSNIDMTHNNAADAGTGYALRILGNNSVQLCTDIGGSNFKWVGDAAAGVVIASQAAGATNALDGIDLVNMTIEIDTAHASNAIQVQGGGAGVIGLHVMGGAARRGYHGTDSSADAVSITSAAGQIVTFSNVNIESSSTSGTGGGGYGLNHNGGGTTILNAVTTRNNPSGGLVIQGGGLVVDNSSQHSNPGVFAVVMGASSTYDHNGVSTAGSAAGLSRNTATTSIVRSRGRSLGINPTGPWAITSASAFSPALPSAGPAASTNYVNKSGGDLVCRITATGTGATWTVGGSTVNNAVGQMFIWGSGDTLNAGAWTVQPTFVVDQGL